jgi:hypothetical protein
MSAKISANVVKRLDEAAITDRHREIPVIVTIRRGADLAALEQKGLKIQRTFQNVSAVAGTIPVGEVNTLAEVDEVEAIDYDETAWAL